jgi:hypothetical protein
MAQSSKVEMLRGFRGADLDLLSIPKVLQGAGANATPQQTLSLQVRRAQWGGFISAGVTAYGFIGHKAWAKVAGPMGLVASAFFWWKARHVLTMLSDMDTKALADDAARAGLTEPTTITAANAAMFRARDAAAGGSHRLGTVGSPTVDPYEGSN